MSDAITDIERGDYAHGPRKRQQQAPVGPAPRVPPEGFGTWIACADEMPCDSGDVLVWAEGWGDPMIYTRYTGPSGHPWLDPESTGPIEPRCWPTHWMPLPAPPQAVADAGQSVSPTHRPQGNDA